MEVGMAPTEEGGVERVFEKIVTRRWVGSVWQHHPRHPEGAADAQVCSGDSDTRHHLLTQNSTCM